MKEDHIASQVSSKYDIVPDITNTIDISFIINQYFLNTFDILEYHQTCIFSTSTPRFE